MSTQKRLRFSEFQFKFPVEKAIRSYLMSKNIWIFNHYVQPPSLGKEQRHSNFANHLIKKGYKVSVFYSSQIHNQPINMISDNKKFKVTTEHSIKYIAIKTQP